MIDTVIHGDVMETLRKLPDNSMNMVYGDPDYGVGLNYAGQKYTQKWEEYLEWYIELAKESMRVLREDGNLFFINYPKQNAYLRVNFLDEVAYEVFDYVWCYSTNTGHSYRKFTTAHRSILHATKIRNNAFYKEQVALPYKRPKDKRVRELIVNGSPGRMPYSWLEFNLVKNTSRDKTIHPCQIPIPLYNTLLNAATVRGDTVFILFGGSGTEIAHTKSQGRHFLSCELHPEYYNMIQNKLENVQKSMPL